MGAAIVTGVFAALLAVLSWLLTNGSKRSRLLSRIERQVAVLKDLPTDHRAKSDLDDCLTADVAKLKVIGARAAKGRDPVLYRWGASLAAVVSVLLAIATFLIANSLAGTMTKISFGF